MQDINTVALTGNLTRDPELKQTGEQSLCTLRVANNGRKKEGDQWVDAPNFFNVVVWGRQADACAQYLEKGRKVAITGKLRWREWTQDDGSKRQAVEIHADNVAFLGGGQQDGGQSRSSGSPADDLDARDQAAGKFDQPPAQGQAQQAAPDDDIPF